MFLHLGRNSVVKTDEIIGIFDLDTATVSKHTRDFLKKAEKAKEVVNVTDELPKSFVVCQKKKTRQKIYISQISPQTLLKRAKRPFMQLGNSTLPPGAFLPPDTRNSVTRSGS